ncbi:hypothetical protein V1527DRAFT_454032 [Lipomyces starkeyi]
MERVICNIAHLVTSQNTSTSSAYAAVKDGVVGLTKASSNDWAGEGTNVTAVSSGYIATSAGYIGTSGG